MRSLAELGCRECRPAIVRPPGVGPDAISRVLRVPPEAARLRLDLFVRNRLRNTSRTRAQSIIRNSAYTLDGRPLRASARLQAEDCVVLWRPAFESDERELELRVLYEDEHLLVVDKPPLVAVHPTARYYRHTVLRHLQGQRPGEYLSLIHRIDRETSGILMLARSLESDRAFKRMLERRTRSPGGDVAADGDIGKTYLAITWGVPPSGLIDRPLELDPESSMRVKMRLARPGCGFRALTTATVLEACAGYALVLCQLHTGRQHQIRLHLAGVGCPVVGDKLYGPDERLLARAADGQLTETDRGLLELPRHALHAHRYRLRHAVSGMPLELVSPFPQDLTRFWAGLHESGEGQTAPRDHDGCA
ncbi:pseudouridine synthase [Myxococcota bacterium]